ncbi:hypothetical protein VCHC68A1_02420A, partial [Vibrio cholerae HC-68A1]
MAFGTFNKNQL